MQKRVNFPYVFQKLICGITLNAVSIVNSCCGPAGNFFQDVKNYFLYSVRKETDLPFSGRCFSVARQQFFFYLSEKDICILESKFKYSMTANIIDGVCTNINLGAEGYFGGMETQMRVAH